MADGKPAVLGKPFQVGLERYCRIEPPKLGICTGTNMRYSCAAKIMGSPVDVVR